MENSRGFCITEYMHGEEYLQILAVGHFTLWRDVMNFVESLKENYTFFKIVDTENGFKCYDRGMLSITIEATADLPYFNL